MESCRCVGISCIFPADPGDRIPEGEGVLPCFNLLFLLFLSLNADSENGREKVYQNHIYTNFVKCEEIMILNIKNPDKQRAKQDFASVFLRFLRTQETREKGQELRAYGEERIRT